MICDDGKKGQAVDVLRLMLQPQLSLINLIDNIRTCIRICCRYGDSIGTIVPDKNFRFRSDHGSIFSYGRSKQVNNAQLLDA